MTGRCPECGHDPSSDELERRCERLEEENKRLREDVASIGTRLMESCARNKPLHEQHLASNRRAHAAQVRAQRLEALLRRAAQILEGPPDLLDDIDAILAEESKG